MNRNDLSPEALAEIEAAERDFAEFVLSGRLSGTGIRAFGIKHHRDKVRQSYARHGLDEPDFSAIRAMHERRGNGVRTH